MSVASCLCKILSDPAGSIYAYFYLRHRSQRKSVRFKTAISKTMYILFPTISFFFLKFTFPSPLQLINSQNLTTIDPVPVETGGIHGIDPRFSLFSQITDVPLDHDQWLVSAVKAMGNVGSRSLIQTLTPGIYDQPDGVFHQVGVSIRSGTAGTTLQTQFAIWGFYLAIKGAIENNRFTLAIYLLCWQGRLVGSIQFWRRGNLPLLPGTKPTQTSQQAASSNQSTIITTGSPDETNSSLSATLPGTEVEIKIVDFGKDLPRNDIIWIVVECISRISSNTPRSPYADAIIISPPHYTVQLHIIPDVPVPFRPRMTVEYVNFAIEWIPGLLLKNGRWSEAHFDILVANFQIAHGLLVKG